jgi:hypothetical protein
MMPAPKAWGWAGGMAVLTGITAIYSIRVLGMSLRALGEAVSPLVFAAALMGGTIYLLRGMLPAMPAIAELLLLVPLGAALYAAVLIAIAPDRLIEVLRFARNRAEESGPAAKSAA